MANHTARVVPELADAAEKLRQQPDTRWHLVAAILQSSADFYGRYPRNWNKDIEAASRAEVALARAVNAPDWAGGGRRFHTPELTESATPGQWRVFCSECSAVAQDYVPVCQGPGWAYAIPGELTAAYPAVTS